MRDLKEGVDFMRLVASRPWYFKRVNIPTELTNTYHRLIAEFYVRRGYVSRGDIEQRFKLSLWNDPKLLPDVELLIHAIEEFRQSGETLYLYGDYDADGCLSLFIMVSFLRRIGVNVLYGQASRHNGGYGISPENVLDAVRQGASGLLVLDCGSNDLEAMQLAAEMGIQTYVLDHHLITTVLPPEIVVINPHRKDSVYPFKGLCTGALAFKVISLYAKTYDVRRNVVAEYLPYAGISLLADSMPMIGESYAIAVHGIKALENTNHVGLTRLLQMLDITAPYSDQNIHFGLIPVLNAPGRLGDPDIVVELLLEQNADRAAEIAKQLIDVNEERRRLTEDVTARVISMIGDTPSASVIFAGNPNFEHGICGIVASRLVDKYKRPCVVLGGSHDGLLIGSGRTVPGTSIVEILDPIREHCLRLGGHEGACGITFEASKYEFIARMVHDLSVPDVQAEVVNIDLSLSLPEVDQYVDIVLPSLRPFGPEHVEPIIHFSQLRIIHCAEKFDKPGTYRLRLADDRGNFINAKCSQNLCTHLGEVVDIVGFLRAGEMNGRPWRLIEIVDICNHEYSPLNTHTTA